MSETAHLSPSDDLTVICGCGDFCNRYYPNQDIPQDATRCKIYPTTTFGPKEAQLVSCDRCGTIHRANAGCAETVQAVSQ
jgi:hypothetical protein